MREKTFERPTVKKIFNLQGLETPRTSRDVYGLIDRGNLVLVTDSYEHGVIVVENLQQGQIALFTTRFRVPAEDSNYGIKSLEDLVKIDSQSSLRGVSGKKTVPARLTKAFAERYRILPQMLIKEAMRRQDVENPPVGFYWVGPDDHARATTWIRMVAGAEMQVMKQHGDFSGEVIDSKPYGRNLRMRVSSRTEEGREHELSLFRLPMYKQGDIRQFSDWISIYHNSSDPDASYRGGEHDKRAQPVCLWSSPPVFSFYEAMRFVKEHPEWMQFKVNPFSIPIDGAMINYTDNFRLQSLIFHDDGENVTLSVLNKGEIDKFIGARTVLRDYDNCWFHWGKKDIRYLYQPKD